MIVVTYCVTRAVDGATEVGADVESDSERPLASTAPVPVAAAEEELFEKIADADDEGVMTLLSETIDELAALSEEAEMIGIGRIVALPVALLLMDTETMLESVELDRAADEVDDATEASELPAEEELEATAA